MGGGREREREREGEDRQTVSVRKVGGSNINVQDDTQPIANGRQCLGVCMGVGWGGGRRRRQTDSLSEEGWKGNINVQDHTRPIANGIKLK